MTSCAADELGTERVEEPVFIVLPGTIVDVDWERLSRQPVAYIEYHRVPPQIIRRIPLWGGSEG